MIANQQVVDALKADFSNSDLDWVMLSAFESEHEHLHLSGETLYQDIARHVTITMQSKVKQITLIISLEGHSGQQATKAILNFLGQAYTITDTAFISLLEAQIGTTGDNIQALLIERLS